MNTKGSNKKSKQGVFRRKYRPVDYNPIHPITIPDHTTTFLGDTAVTSNEIGKDNDRLLGMFCYDADGREM